MNPQYNNPNNPDQIGGNIELAIELYNKRSMPIGDILKKCRVSQKRLYTEIQERGVNKRRRIMLTDLESDDIRLMFELRFSGMTIEDIAEKFECDPHVVSAALKSYTGNIVEGIDKSITFTDLKNCNIHEDVPEPIVVTVRGTARFVLMPLTDYKKLVE